MYTIAFVCIVGRHLVVGGVCCLPDHVYSRCQSCQLIDSVDSYYEFSHICFFFSFQLLVPLAFLELYGSSSTQLAFEDEKEPENEQIRPIRSARGVPGLKFASQKDDNEGRSEPTATATSTSTTTTSTTTTTDINVVDLDDNDVDSGVPAIVIGGGSVGRLR